MTIPQGREAAVFFSLRPDTAQGDEPALLKLSQCESVGCPLLLHAQVLGEPYCTRGGPALAAVLGACRETEPGWETLQDWWPGFGHGRALTQPYCSSPAW